MENKTIKMIQINKLSNDFQYEVVEKTLDAINGEEIATRVITPTTNLSFPENRTTIEKYVTKFINDNNIKVVYDNRNVSEDEQPNLIIIADDLLTIRVDNFNDEIIEKLKLLAEAKKNQTNENDINHKATGHKEYDVKINKINYGQYELMAERFDAEGKVIGTIKEIYTEAANGKDLIKLGDFIEKFITADKLVEVEILDGAVEKLKVVRKDGSTLVTEYYNHEIVDLANDNKVKTYEIKKLSKKGIRNISIGAIAVIVGGFILLQACVYNGKSTNNKPLPTPKPTTAYSDTKDLLTKAASEENAFDPNDANEIAKVVNDLKGQTDKETGLNLEKDKLIKLVLVVNDVKVNDVDFFNDVFLPLEAISNIDIAPAVHKMSGQFKTTDERTPVTIENIFANKKDRAMVKVFSQGSSDIINALYANKEKAEVQKIIDSYYEKECRALIVNDAIATDEGSLKIDSISEMAKLVIIKNVYTTNNIIAQLNSNYAITFDAVNDVQKTEPETFRLNKVGKELATMLNNTARDIALLVEQPTKGKTLTKKDC